MFILLTIFLLLIIPLAMLIFHLARPKFSIQGFLVVMAILAGWPMVWLARQNIPQVISLLSWEPADIFTVSPALMIDDISWYFALALMSLAFSLVITSIARLGLSRKPGYLKTHDTPGDNVNAEPGQEETPTSVSAQAEAHSLAPNWQSWASMLVLTGFGLVAVTAGNLLTLVMAWVAIDLIELVILLGQVMESKPRERIVLAFSARMAGIGILFLAGILPWSHGISLSFSAISPSTSIYLLVAAGLRLGVLPLHIPYTQVLPVRRGLGTMLRLVPAASSYILLVRVAEVCIQGAIIPYLLGLTILAGLYAGINWLLAQDELSGRPFWLLGTASLAVAASILGLPIVCIAWSITSLLSGGLIFSMSMRHKNLIPIAILGIFNLSALPFSPTWQGISYQQSGSLSSNAIPPFLFYLLWLALLLIHALLLSGMVRHILRGIYPSEEEPGVHVERWVWFLYPLGLVFISVSHLLIGLLLLPGLDQIPVSAWFLGAIIVAIAGLIVYISRRFPKVLHPRDAFRKVSPLNNALSLTWLYKALWRGYRYLSKLIALLSSILEGDGGILWALVLFALIFVFLQK